MGAVENVMRSLSVIEEKDSEINAFITVADEKALLRRAREVDDGINRGIYDSPLAGMVIAVKDNIMTAGLKTTCASEKLRDFIPPYSAAVVERLTEAGLIIIGKTNMDEFAFGSTTETSCFGSTKNPYDTTRTPGGSSGGSAAAVAAGMVELALGSDTGGSVRQPASYCGIYGLKPTYGAVSRFGLTSYASSMDQIGPFATSVDDCEALFSIIAGFDERDSNSIHYNPDSMPEKPVIGVPEKYASELICAIRRFKEAGIKVREFKFSFDIERFAAPAYYIIACAEGCSNLARFDGIRYGDRNADYCPELKARLEMGNLVLSEGFYDEYYIKASKIRRLIRNAYDEVLKGFDCILSPVVADTAPILGHYDDDRVKMYAADTFTVPANLTGLPALCIPVEKKDSLPKGAQLMGRAFSENLLFCLARQIEGMI